MAGIDLATAESQLATWLEALTAVASGQSVNVAGRTLTRANLREIGEQVTFWDRQVQRLSRGGIRVSGGVPL